MNLEEKAKEIRRFVWNECYRIGSGHLGGTFSCIEILVALYYGGIFDCRKDKFLIGKGHAYLAIYYILAEIGFFDKKLLDDIGKDGAILGGQLDISTPGVEYNTGSLGHVIGIACGMSMANRLDGKDAWNIALVGDGECEEGSIWESLVFAARQKLDRIIVIVDRNRLSVLSEIEDYGFYDACRSIGWKVYEADGHNTIRMLWALRFAKNEGGLIMIVANTIKGKGVSFLEGSPDWHNNSLTEEQYRMGLEELGGH